MSATTVILIIGAYFLLLIGISFLTASKADSSTFFTGNRQSPWYLVAFGMIGASLSGVTFISVPGWVGTSQFSYLQVVLGYLVGYFVIATVLMPLYYRLNLVSIYGYLEQRFGFWSYKTGAFYFLLSRTIGAAFRLFLVAGVLQLAIFDAWNVPFHITVFITILLIWLYTFRGGIRTIVWTDTLQTLFMLMAVVFAIYLIGDELDMTTGMMVEAVRESEYSKIFFWEWEGPKNFFKQFISGAFIAIVMTGLDQDMMQKNLTCRNLQDAQKNMFWFSITLVFVNLLFLMLGALLYIYAGTKGIAIPERTDDLFPMLALDYFPVVAGITFLLGITAAAYSSADSALTALTTSFCVDFLGFKREETLELRVSQRRKRFMVHIGFSLLLFLLIVLFREVLDGAVIQKVFEAAGYTYGPLLGLYAFGLFTKKQVRDPLVPVICLISPVLSYLLNINSEKLLFGYKFGFEILLVNGLFTFIGMVLLIKSGRPHDNEDGLAVQHKTN
ncbi:sodium:solute symporter [Fulvivirga sedimenti]|uniref:Sodium:solute symporter n=1 Tax=Fulvivirga sedimenti TaxID=2879465 RepID=A0A9X1HL94_9BACT|nr:sodium:solute symporter [Fulvivirga sedimenti]MCA6074248.1 sodium:solute symporter [Fulvivirga sedimenti]